MHSSVPSEPCTGSLPYLPSRSWLPVCSPPSRRTPPTSTSPRHRRTSIACCTSTKTRRWRTVLWRRPRGRTRRNVRAIVNWTGSHPKHLCPRRWSAPRSPTPSGWVVVEATSVHCVWQTDAPFLRTESPSNGAASAAPQPHRASPASPPLGRKGASRSAGAPTNSSSSYPGGTSRHSRAFADLRHPVERPRTC